MKKTQMGKGELKPTQVKKDEINQIKPRWGKDESKKTQIEREVEKKGISNPREGNGGEKRSGQLDEGEDEEKD